MGKSGKDHRQQQQRNDLRRQQKRGFLTSIPQQVKKEQRKAA